MARYKVPTRGKVSSVCSVAYLEKRICIQGVDDSGRLVYLRLNLDSPSDDDATTINRMRTLADTLNRQASKLEQRNAAPSPVVNKI